MNKNLLCAAILGTLVVAQTVKAQEFDDRWYATGGVTLWDTDKDRDIGKSELGYQFGVGRFVTPNVSLDAEFNYMNPEKVGNDLHFSNYGLSLDGRYHFLTDGSNWNPYLLAGAGVLRHREQFELIDNPNSPGQIKGNNIEFHFGGGLQGNFGHWGVRAEVRARMDNNDESAAAPQSDYFKDVGLSLGLLYRFGELAKPAPPAEPEPVAPPPPPPPTCDQLDDDGDGVNNCEDKCPASQAGQAIGPDGCPVALTIDLRGVNFDFDKATLRSDSTAILDEAIMVLTKYPQLKVEVAGHTDSVGAETYNQGLSERRAKTVYDYLLAHGVTAGQLVGPNGYGESHPIDTNDTSEGRARNRRTELNVQN